MDVLSIRPRGPLDARVRVPGSKSLTNRALPVAALARGRSQIAGALDSDDTEAMRDCLAELGVRIDARTDPWLVEGRGGLLDAPQRTLDARASGTTARFITAIAALGPGPSRIDGTARMRERPIVDLTRALAQLGAEVEIEGRDGCPPVRVNGGGLAGGGAVVDASRSSQFVTAVLLAAPFAERDVCLSLKDGVIASRPYVELTLRVMRDFGAEVGWQDESTLRVGAGHPYQSRHYAVEPDASSAAYPFSAAAIAGGRVRVLGIPRDSIQADLGLLDVLARMGCRVERGEDYAELRAPTGRLRGIDVDMNATPDAALALAAVALFADGPTLIRNVVQLRHHETDRLSALEAELRRLGARAQAGPDSLRIEPAALHGATIHTYDDHRMAMAFALVGLRVPGVVIEDPACVAKTWPDYFAALERL
ncbi:MAG: 3-phosphoshikimate 1-carboxyvinyltransferase [Myxococcota bacterium]